MKRMQMAKVRIFRIIMVLACVIALVVAVLPIQAAQAELVSSPDQAGPYHVGWYLVSYYQSPYGNYNAIVYYPAKWDGFLAPKETSGGLYPGIVVGNGFFGADWNITWIPNHLASYGYIALVFTPPCIASMDTTQWAKGFNGGIDKLKSQSRQLLSPIRNLLNTSTFGIIGFSMGGAGAIECASNNPEVDVVVGLAPANDETPLLSPAFDKVRNAAKNLKVPVIFQAGSNDSFIKAQWVDDLYNLVPNTTTKEFIEITGANHIGNLDLWICPIAELIENVLGGKNTIGWATQHSIESRYFTSWFQYYLKDKNEYSPYLFGDQAQSDLDSRVLSVWKYNKP